MNNLSQKEVKIMMVEDNPGDVELTREALRSSKLTNELEVYDTGQAALAALFHQIHAGGLPDLILLDLNLPGLSGTEVLKQIKSHGLLGRIPVVILTSSQSEVDIVKSYDLHANCYVTKPIEFSQFIEVVQSVQSFWFTLVRLPEQP